MERCFERNKVHFSYLPTCTQIRRHLNGMSTPILGDGTHGSTKINRKWKKKGFRDERIGLHLIRLQLPSTETVGAIDVVAPLPEDLKVMWRVHVPSALELVDAKFQMVRSQRPEIVQGIADEYGRTERWACTS